jgi:hypothetical protein
MQQRIIMKVNLFGDTLRNGYLNIVPEVSGDLSELPEDTQVMVGNIDSLNSTFENNSVEEIVFNPPLNVLQPTQLVGVLQQFNTKLKKDGRLKIGFFDIRRLGRFIANGELTLQQVDGFIFGPQHQYQCLVDTNVLEAVLKGVGYQIDILSSKDFIVTIEAVKNVD